MSDLFNWLLPKKKTRWQRFSEFLQKFFVGAWRN